MDLTTWKNKGTFFHYREHRIFTIDEGNGPVILLIHGFPTSSWDWWKMWPELIKSYRLLTLDMIGFGFSDKPKRYNYRIFDQADLIEKLLMERDVKEVHLLSHDYGDTVVQELLARQKEASETVIKSVCLLNGGLFPETHRPLLVQKLLMGPLGSFVAQLFTRKKLGKNFRQIFGPTTPPSESELDEFWELISGNGGKEVFHLLIRYMRERVHNRSRWVGALQSAKVPLRLINGTMDPISGGHMVERYRQLIASPDTVELDGIGHYPNVEAPEMVLKYYLDFLKRV